jgi:hypothetical protein
MASVSRGAGQHDSPTVKLITERRGDDLVDWFMVIYYPSGAIALTEHIYTVDLPNRKVYYPDGSTAS